MKFLKTLIWALFQPFLFLENLFLSISLYKTFRVFLCNHLTIGIRYLHDKKVKFPHPVGIVIGKKVRIGTNCIIYQNVTIGTKDTINYMVAKYPIIGDNVTIFANSVIFGNISIGDNSVIGAGSVVNMNIPPDSIVVGNPAKIFKKNHE